MLQRLPSRKSRSRPSVSNQAEVKKYVTGTNSSPGHQSEPKTRKIPILADWIHNLKIISQKQTQQNGILRSIMEAFY